VQGLGAVHDRVRVDALHHLGGGVEEAPRVPGTEVLVSRGAPLLEDAGDLAGRDRPAVRGLDDEVVGLWRGDAPIPVAGDALVDLQEPLAETADRTRGEVPEVALGEPGVLATDPHLTTERQVIANHDFGASHQAGGVGLVVRVADPDDPAVVAIGPPGDIDLEEAEVARPLVGEGVVLAGEPEAGGLQLGLDLVDEAGVRQRIPGVRARGGGDVVDRPTVDEFGAAVEKHALRRRRLAGCCVFDELVHGVFDFRFGFVLDGWVGICLGITGVSG